MTQVIVIMIFDYKFKNKTIYQLRKDKGLTCVELANMISVNPTVLTKLDKVKLKEVPKPLYQKLYDALEP
jgi:ribosome-binding protein aMBF1 (putative translation factor)